MLTKTTAAIVTIALLGVVAFSVIGQEEPLPAVIPAANPTTGAIPLAEPTIVLAAEPIREYRPPTLSDAARHNDYITFDALYTAAKRRGENVSQFDALHELWTYSVTDPIGAFYGQELYQRLSRAYPRYPAFIDEFRVLDDRGHAFYPTSETRAFLLDQAVEGRPGPRGLVAETPRPGSTSAVERRSLPAAVPVVAAQGVVARKERAAQRARTLPPAALAQPSATWAKPSATLAAAAPAPTVVATQTAAATAAPLDANSAAPQVNAAPPVYTAPAAAEPVVIVANPAAPAAAPVPVSTATPASSNPASRGILLMITGLIGVGLLALVLRTPREEPLVIHPVNRAANNVEPLRKPPATDADEPRASGSAAG